MFFDIKNIAFSVFGHSVSYTELIGAVFGLISVYLATRANILTWATGIINEFFLFLLFFQVQLYADMFLQFYFLIVTLYGWYNWRNKNTIPISYLSIQQRIVTIVIITVLSLISGLLVTKLHLILPIYFPLPADYPYEDSFIMICSMVATILLAKKKIENWYLWIVVDICCVILYYNKQIYFLSFEYAIFMILACYGLFSWQRRIKNG